MKRWIAIAAVAAAVSSVPAFARNDAYALSIREVLNSPEFAAKVGTVVKFAVADEPIAVASTIVDYEATGRGHYEGRPEEEACKGAMINALFLLRQRAQRSRGDAVTGIVGNFRGRPYVSRTNYDCHAGASGVFVVLKGTVVKLQK